MSEKINLQNSTQLHARKLTATINKNGRFISQLPLNCQVVAQNIIVTEALTHNQ